MENFLLKDITSDKPRIRQIRILEIGHIGGKEFTAEDWSIVLIDYCGMARINDNTIELTPGTVLILPPNTKRSYSGNGTSPHRQANFKIGHKSHNKGYFRSNAGHRFGFLCTLFDETFVHFQHNQFKAEIILWSLIWQLESIISEEPQKTTKDALVKKTMAIIERNISTRLYVSDIAKQLAVSHNTLTNAFQAQLHCTVVGYIRQRRMNHANYLLQYTDLPIKAIAYEVGLPDLQQFNHCVRRTFGKGPREIRKGSLQ